MGVKHKDLFVAQKCYMCIYSTTLTLSFCRCISLIFILADKFQFPFFNNEINNSTVHDNFPST